jgi:AcrR family transcriptional regulator
LTSFPKTDAQYTIDDTAKELGLSKGALCSYFKNKKDILKEILRSNHQILREILGTPLDGRDYMQVTEKAYKLMTEKYSEFVHTFYSAREIGVRGMGFEPMQPYGNRSLKALPIPIQTFCIILGGVLLSLSPLAKLGHPR